MPYRILCLALAVVVGAAPAGAGDIVGVVTVLEKGGAAPLKSFENAVVFVVGLRTPPPGAPAMMDQHDKTFTPRLLPVIAGQQVRFLNSDSVQHNVFSPHADEPFDLGRYAAGEHRTFTFKVPGRHRIYCDIHQRMIADVFVLPGKYHALTDARGAFRIEGVPAGAHTLRAWHIFGGAGEAAVQVPETGAVRIDFSLESQKVVLELEDHYNKSGRPYAPSEYNPSAF